MRRVSPAFGDPDSNIDAMRAEFEEIILPYCADKLLSVDQRIKKIGKFIDVRSR